jgi:hypothetical protein
MSQFQRSTWTDDQVALLRQLRLEGLTQRECAARLGKSELAIERACRRYNCPKRFAYRKQQGKNGDAISDQRSDRLRRETDEQARKWAGVCFLRGIHLIPSAQPPSVRRVPVHPKTGLAGETASPVSPASILGVVGASIPSLMEDDAATAGAGALV